MRCRLVIAAALSAALCCAAPPSALGAEVHLVAIGNNVGYSDELELRYAERDAVAVATVLQQLGDVRGEHTVLSLGRKAADVRRAVLGASARVRDAGPGSVLIVYYSGHADARGLHLGGSTLPYEELEALVTASPADMRLLVIDACRSGGATRVKGIRAAERFDIGAVDRIAAQGMAIISSSAAGEDSHESDRLRASFFSHHLVTALRGAGDDNADGRVSLDEAYAYTYHHTLRSSGQTTQLQHPTYRFDVRGRGALILTHTGKHAADAAQLRLPGPALYLIMEGHESGPVAAEVAVGPEGTSLSLPPRHYLVQRRSASSYREYEVSLSTGRTVDVAGEAFRTVAYARLLRKGGGERGSVHGLALLGGVRGEVLDGQGPTAQVVLAYALELPWLTFGLRGRFAPPVSAGGAIADGSHLELGLGLTAQRFIDVGPVALGVGILAEVGYVAQRFDTAGHAPARDAVTGGFGGLVTVQVELSPSWAIQLEGGPMTQIFERTTVRAGAPAGRETATPLTFWTAGGLLWRF